MKLLLLPLLGLFFCLAAPARAQFGDRPSGPRQEVLPFARHPVPSPALTPQQEKATFRLPPGLRVELVAAEPLVHDPVAAAFDRSGSLWLVEFSTFNSGMIRALPGLAAGVQLRDVPSCKIVKLESSHHDGRFDRRVVWLDGLEGAKGIALVRDGVLISDPPRLWLARDTHGTGHCDDRQLLLDNYEAWSDPEESGSLLWGRDNVLHDIDFSYDYRYHAGTLERISVPIRGQFGITQDDDGRLFYSRSTDHLHGDLYPAAYSVRNSNLLTVPWVNATIAPSEEVWPSHPTITNRGYRVGILGQHMDGVRADGRLLEFTAACSPLIYRGTALPADCYGDAFVPDPAGNLVHRDHLRSSGGRLTATSAYPGTEFLTATDARFRPVDLLNAPDGSLVVVDMYRGIVEEYHYITTYLREQSLARGLDRPLFGLGRIWRVVADTVPAPAPAPELDRLGAAGVAAALRSPNGWWRDTAQQELVERGDWSAAPILRDIALHAPLTASRIAALWTLDGLKATTLELLGAALKDSAAPVRAAAVRLHERWLSGAQAGPALRQIAAVIRDPAPEVRVQLGLSLGEDSDPAALAIMLDLLLASDDCPDLPSALASGLAGREAVFLAALEQRIAAPDRARLQVAAMLRELATAIVHQGDKSQIGDLLAAMGDAARLPIWARRDLLSGLEPLLAPSFRRSVGPTRLMTSDDLTALTVSPDLAIRAQARRIARGLAQAEAEAKRRAAAARPLNAEEQRRYTQGQAIFQICAGCHQPGGGGLAHVAPSLVDSRWVASYPEVIIRIVLCGKEGTPGFAGPMPPIGSALNDEQIAAVATYVRNSWGLHEGAVSAATVARVRADIGSRQAAWNNAELQRVEGTIRDLGAKAFVPPPRR